MLCPVISNISSVRTCHAMFKNKRSERAAFFLTTLKSATGKLPGDLRPQKNHQAIELGPFSIANRRQLRRRPWQ